MIHVTIVGTGYVGLVTGTCLAGSGNQVTCLDIDAAKVARMQAGECPIFEPGLEELMQHNAQAGRLHFTTDKQAAYANAHIVFLCVGTPTASDGHADLSYILQAAADIGRAIEASPGVTGSGAHEVPKIIVIKSTVPVGTNTRVQAAIAAHTSKPFLMASNPEFLKEGAAVEDFRHPDRVVLGVDNPTAGRILHELYEPFTHRERPIFTMDIRSAEMVKYASNCMLATKISFINEIAGLCEAFAADVDQVWEGMTADSRIGKKFLYPGLGYGGSCFPKDVQAAVAMGREANQPANLLAQVHATNQQQRIRFLQRILKHFNGDLTGKRIAVWGIAFKPRTDDIREAPSLDIMQGLLAAGASITAHDPVAMDSCRSHGLKERIAYADDPYEALNGADALIICTEWSPYRRPDFAALRSRMKTPLVFDGRNIWPLDLARRERLVYHSIGRPSVHG
jgi:UDPglucose 6-dehydrogenase